MCYLGIDLGGTNIATGVIDRNGKLLSKQSMPTGAPCSPQELCDRIALAAQIACAEAEQTVQAVGIGCPGSVNRNSGVVELTPNLPFRHFPIREELERRLHLPIGVDNDANAAAWGEFKAGALKGAHNAVAITLGTGVGSGLILNGKIYAGQNGAAGEMGHMVIERDGRACNCGRRGCWEKYASATGLILTTRELMEQDTAHESALWQMVNGDLNQISGRSAFDAMRKGDVLGAKVVEVYIRDLSCGLINIINSLQPDTICIGGGISHEGEALLAPTKAIVEKEQYVTNSPIQTKLVTAKLGNDAGIIGAALSGAELCGQ
ncbi:MAG: ROK family glucokinase [Clostridium sp.]|uniref:ROK family protein n=1 Tax=Clostridium sp. TaxID=1506 RepID=UPI002906A6C2|nr:ROK family glucokinase [Clostridium sp.]MDU7337789.1 ROK family glucokinase [Clostridium sp.]